MLLNRFTTQIRDILREARTASLYAPSQSKVHNLSSNQNHETSRLPTQKMEQGDTKHLPHLPGDFNKIKI
jgi:hypothetical protein